MPQNTTVFFGPDSPCTLTTCPLDQSIYEYRPSLAANAVFIALFGLAMIIQIAQGFRYKTWFFLVCMFPGCVTEIIGYAGRIMLWQNPFSFNGFLMQICCITFAPAFFSAAIYITLSKIINYLDPTVSRFNPKFLYWVFIPCDLLSLTLQGTGGGLSTSAGQGGHASNSGVDIALAGLAFQVFTLAVFGGLIIDYFVRWWTSRRRHAASDSSPLKPLTLQFKVFLSFLALATLLIFIRCVYRIDELSDGYHGALIHSEGLFIGLEGVMVAVAVYCFTIAHPGPVFKDKIVFTSRTGSSDAALMAVGDAQFKA